MTPKALRGFVWQNIVRENVLTQLNVYTKRSCVYLVIHNVYRDLGFVTTRTNDFIR